MDDRHGIDTSLCRDERCWWGGYSKQFVLAGWIVVGFGWLGEVLGKGRFCRNRRIRDANIRSERMYC